MADIIDFQIFGDDMQIVEIGLDPGWGSARAWIMTSGWWVGSRTRSSEQKGIAGLGAGIIGGLLQGDR